jgi:glutamine synthetase
MFGNLVFNDTVMREKLPENVYEALEKTMHRGSHLELEVANIVADAMKDWALEKGATHFTHWFQPMTGVTAEKHDSFIAPDPSNPGQAIMKFSGKALVRGEPDASSFPSGGLRATFEARGYTVWDTTSYAFLKDSTLCIPTAFCSYGGEALDKKTPLLRSMDAINTQALRVLRLLGDESVKRVTPMVGAEQEYFLIDKEMYLRRPDLVYTGRTLFGASPPKGEELHDHYFGSLTPRVAAFMEELDEELWRLGVFAKTKHNEVAPAQHELAVIYTSANIATDHNQIIMELMKTVANRHDLACLLHEKPFEGVSGSGKHNNWSLSTDTGINLLEPGKTPHENAQFLLFLTAVIKATDEYCELLRASAASVGNDRRLGANEAPPPIVSIFLGEELTEILESLESGEKYVAKGKQPMEIGVTALPHFRKHTTDRNRTSPFAFTGNKFEFRMLGSSASIADSNTVINTAVAEALRQFADYIENGNDSNAGIASLITQAYTAHKRIIFNGDNYCGEWFEEAKKRELPCAWTTVTALPAYITQKSIDLFEKHTVLTESELKSRYEILMENYQKIVRIEELTMTELIRGEVIPAVIAYQNELVKLLKRKESLVFPLENELEKRLLTRISELSSKLVNELDKPDSMSRLREIVDELETLIAKKHRPFPSYGEILYSVN